MSNRLNISTLAQMPKGVIQPGYTPANHGVGIVHIGVGAFHRAHQACYTDTCLTQEGGDWRIMGISPRTPRAEQQLNPQNGLFSVVERSEGKPEKCRVVASIAGVITASGREHEAIKILSDDAVRIISITVTEKGYHYDLGSRSLQLDDAGIRSDLANMDTPVTTIGLLVAGLNKRMALGGKGVTLLSCDNLPNNGKVLRLVVERFASEFDDTGRLTAWIREHVTFPSTMVDRIVPAVGEKELAAFEATYGLHDAAMVATEAYSEWVIEDNFASGRPNWALAGAKFVKDVEAYEKVKLRLLNGTHSALAYLGLIDGYSYVHELPVIPEFSALLNNIVLLESGRTVAASTDLDLQAYLDGLMNRYRNSFLNHRLAQIATDGSQKLPQRIIQPLMELDAEGVPTPALKLALAAWMYFVSYTPAAPDPLLGKLSTGETPETLDFNLCVNQLLDVREIFPRELKDIENIADELTAYLQLFHQQGATESLRRILMEKSNYRKLR